MKKKVLLTCALIASQFVNAQNSFIKQMYDEQDLTSFFKVEVGFDGISAHSENKLGENLLLDTSAGIGGSYEIVDDEFKYAISSMNAAVFTRLQLRYYINRHKRLTKGRKLTNNAGTFVAIQTKFSLGKSENYDQSVMWLNDIHIGQQLPLGEKFIFRYHIGVGKAFQLTEDLSSFYPAAGVSFGYKF